MTDEVMSPYRKTSACDQLLIFQIQVKKALFVTTRYSPLHHVLSQTCRRAGARYPGHGSGGLHLTWRPKDTARNVADHASDSVEPVRTSPR